MKCVSLNLIFIFVYCFFISFGGVHLDSKEKSIQEHSEVYATEVSTNASDLANKEVDSESTENSPVPEAESYNVDTIDPSYTHVVKEVPTVLLAEDGMESVTLANEFIKNDTPIKVPTISSITDELDKEAFLASPLLNDKDFHNATSNTSKSTSEVQETPISDTTETTDSQDQTTSSNLTTTDTADTKAQDIPSFSEWTQKHLEEAEKRDQVNGSTLNQNANGTKPISNAKLRWKNYASADCGAKVILANPETQHSWAMLVSVRDEYALNPCKSRMWFIVELCEAIQLKKIDLANYELFSSLPENFTVSISDRFPTRDWSVVGHFTAKEERNLQSFDVNTEAFGKYVKVEIRSHYGSEHYCPVSIFRAYGMSVFEVLQKDDPAHEPSIDDDDDGDEEPDLFQKEVPSSNILSSATDAVLSMVKKVLGNKVNRTDDSSETIEDRSSIPAVIKSCTSPSHYVLCNNCSDTLFGKIYQLLSCNPRQITNLVSIPFISNALFNASLCYKFGLDFSDKSANATPKSNSLCVDSFFPQYFIGAMCNVLGIVHHKVLYNISQQYPNVTQNGSSIQDNFVEAANGKGPEVIPPIDTATKTAESVDRIENGSSKMPLTLEKAELNSLKSSCSTDTTHVSDESKSMNEPPVQLHPTKLEDTESGQAEEKEDAESSSSSSSTTSTIATSGEVAQNDAEVQVDSTGLEESVDKLMTELNSETGSPTATVPSIPVNLQGQKESIFLRLSNRIKALERNMSLSGQYLEELSKRYKKQVEEMQRVLDKTEQALNQANQKMEERNHQMEDRLDYLTKTVEKLSEEKDNCEMTSYCLYIVVAFLLIVCCFNRFSSSNNVPTTTTNVADKPAEIHRRNSIDIVNRSAPKKKKRRPSDQALKVVASAAAVASGDQFGPNNHRRKKVSNASLNKHHPAGGGSNVSSVKNPNIPGPGDWVEQEGRTRVVDHVPFPLEESDSYVLDDLPSMAAPELRQIEIDAHVKTATSCRLNRINRIKRIDESKDEEVRSRSDSPSAKSLGPSLNGSVSSGNESVSKKGKGFKRFFKKAFYNN